MSIDGKPSVFWDDIDLKQKVLVEITTETGNRVERMTVDSIGPCGHPDLIHVTFVSGISRYAPKTLLIDSPLSLRFADLCRRAAEQVLLERQLNELNREAERVAAATVLQAAEAEVGQTVRLLAKHSGMHDTWFQVTEIACESISDEHPDEIVLAGHPDRFPNNTIQRVCRPDELLEVDAERSALVQNESAAQAA